MSKKLHLALSGFVFVAIWTVAITLCFRDTRMDPDLGISTSKLPLTQNAMWSLPSTIGVWVMFEGVLLLAHWQINRKRPDR